MRKIIKYNFKIRVFKNIKFFYKIYKFVFIDKLKNDFKIKYYFKNIIKFVKRKLLFNNIINNKYYNINRI